MTGGAQLPGMVASYYTLSGGGISEVGPHSLLERAHAAEAAGFSGIGLSLHDLDHILSTDGNVEAIRALLDAHHLRLGETEFLHGWSDRDYPSDQQRETEQRMFELSAALGSEQINIGDTNPRGSLDALEAVAGRLAKLADRAQDYGLRLAVEFAPYRGISDLRMADALLSAVDRPNAGLLIDAWHFFRGRNSLDDLAAIDPARIFGLQLADANTDVVGTLQEDTILRRRLVGEGSYAIDEFIATIVRMGATPIFAVEVISVDQRALPVGLAAQRAADSTRKVLEAGFRLAAL